MESDLRNALTEFLLAAIMVGAEGETAEENPLCPVQFNAIFMENGETFIGVDGDSDGVTTQTKKYRIDLTLVEV